MTTNQDFTHSSGGNGDKINVNFYNTIHLKGEELKQAFKDVNTQAEKILAFVKLFPNDKFTSCEIRKFLVDNGIMSERTQETTVKARLTDLLQSGHLIKHNEMRDGFYGKPNHLWQLKPLRKVEPMAVVVNNIPLPPFGTQHEMFV